jgi:ABC-type hemin transport system substrate-binding protein
MIGEEYRAEVEKPARKKGVAPLQQILGLTLALALIWAMFAPPATQQGSAADAPAPRVASTSPAITDSIVELGLGAHIVGRSGYCRTVDAAVPVVGDLRSFDAERLALARPGILFVQPPLAGVDPALEAFCGERSIELVARRLDRLADLAALADDIERVFGAQQADPALPWRARLAGVRATLAPSAPNAPQRHRVLVLVSAEPFLAVGRGNYLDELLTRAGFVNAVEAEGWVELSAETILALAPARAVGIAETRAGALEIAGYLEVMPWKGAPPSIGAEAMPALLSPSFAALAQRDAFMQLLELAPAAADAEAAP